MKRTETKRVLWDCPHAGCAAANTLLAPPATSTRTRGTATARWILRAPCLRCGRTAFLSGLSLFDPHLGFGEPLDFAVRAVEPG